MRRKGDLTYIPGKLKRLASDYLHEVLNYGIRRVSFDRFRKMTPQEVSHFLCGEIIEVVFGNGYRGILFDPDSYPEIYDSNDFRFQMKFKGNCFFRESGFNVISFSNLKKKAAPEFFFFENWLIEHEYGNGGILALFLCDIDVCDIFKAAEKVAKKDGERLYYSSLFPKRKRGGGEKSGNRMRHKERIELAKAINRGDSTTKIARAFGVSRQTVYNVRKKSAALFMPENIKFFIGETKKNRNPGRASFVPFNDNLNYSAGL